jgi:hypothetical protein
VHQCYERLSSWLLIHKLTARGCSRSNRQYLGHRCSYKFVLSNCSIFVLIESLNVPPVITVQGTPKAVSHECRSDSRGNLEVRKLHLDRSVRDSRCGYVKLYPHRLRGGLPLPCNYTPGMNIAIDRQFTFLSSAHLKYKSLDLGQPMHPKSHNVLSSSHCSR